MSHSVVQHIPFIVHCSLLMSIVEHGKCHKFLAQYPNGATRATRFSVMQWMNEWLRTKSTNKSNDICQCSMFNVQGDFRSNSMMRSFIQSFSKSFDMWSGWKAIFITTTESIKECCEYDKWLVLFPIFSAYIWKYGNGSMPFFILFSLRVGLQSNYQFVIYFIFFCFGKRSNTLNRSLNIRSIIVTILKNSPFFQSSLSSSSSTSS